MVYAETGCVPLSISIKVTLIKYWIKIVNGTENRLIHVAYQEMLTNTHTTNWTTKVKDILFETGYGFIWIDQNVPDSKTFLKQFQTRCMDMYIQQCYSDVENSNRCRTYRGIKNNFEMEPYLKSNVTRDLRVSFTKLRLSSHRFMVERGRWMKPKIEFSDRICILCDDHDIQDEYHIVLRCAFFHTQRTKYINKHYYVRPSMYKFVNLMNSTKKREVYRLMVFMK